MLQVGLAILIAYAMAVSIAALFRGIFGAVRKSATGVDPEKAVELRLRIIQIDGELLEVSKKLRRALLKDNPLFRRGEGSYSDHAKYVIDNTSESVEAAKASISYESSVQELMSERQAKMDQYEKAGGEKFSSHGYEERLRVESEILGGGYTNSRF